MHARVKLVSVFAVVLTLVITGAVAAGDPATPAPAPPAHIGAFEIRLPESPAYQGQEPAFVVPPLFGPANAAGYAPHRLGEPVTPADGRPVAQFTPPPTETQAMEIMLPPVRQAKANEVSFSNLASVRYTVAGHDVLVTTFRPSLAASERLLVLGQRTVQLTNGATAWVTSGLIPTYPGGPTNQVVQVRGDLLITVASDLAPDQVTAWAADIPLQR